MLTLKYNWLKKNKKKQNAANSLFILVESESLCGNYDFCQDHLCVFLNFFFFLLNFLPFGHRYSIWMYRSVFWVTPDSDRHHSGSGSTVCVESKNSNLSLFKLSPTSAASSSLPGFYFLLQCGSAVISSFHSSPPVLRPRQRASSSYHISLVSVALSLVAH